MTPTFIEAAAVAVSDAYGADRVRRAADGGRTLVRIEGVEMPPGCTPKANTMLLVLDPGESKPQVYVGPGQLLANGNAPRSTSVVTIGGESWLQYSFNIPWSEEHGIIRFVAAARQRFAQND